MSTKDLSVVIIGGGIAGLSTATALKNNGHKVLVLEAAPEWATAGWGLSLTGPCLRALKSIGALDACLEIGYGVSKITNCTFEGVVGDIIDLPKLVGQENPSQVGIGRPALQKILLDTATKAGVEFKLDVKIVDIKQHANGATVVLADGSEYGADLVIGADGVRSQTRQLIGKDIDLQYTGQFVWRALVPRPEWLTSLHTFEGQKHNGGVIPISSAQAYFFVTENDVPFGIIPDELLLDKLMDLVKNFRGIAAEIRDSVDEHSGVIRRPVQAQIVPKPWHKGRVVLVGDAAHSPSPQLVSGAAIAVEDGVILAEELAKAHTIEDALEAYVERRFARCALVIENSIEIGRLEREGKHGEVHALQGRTHGAMAQPA